MEQLQSKGIRTGDGIQATEPQSSGGNKGWVTLKEGALVSSGFHNTIPETRWPKQQTLIFLQFWSLEIPHQGPTGSVSGEKSLPDIGVLTFSPCPHMALPSHASTNAHTQNGVGREEGREFSPIPSSKGPTFTTSFDLFP